MGERAPGGLGAKRAHRRAKKIEFAGLDGGTALEPRRATGVAEFDRVCGGGLVPGSAVLIGGDPGIGKSTLLLQVAAALGTEGKGKSGAMPCAYISGEEAVEQLRMRARRLGLDGARVPLATATSVRDIAASLDSAEAPVAVVVDSIQTLYVDSLESAPGTVSQVRASAQELIRLAKARGFTLLLVGHVTKDGQLAGPKVLEHMVDTVLTIEGERGHQFRILRATKNRFRADRRDRGLRDDRWRPDGGRQPLGPVPERAARRCLRGRGVRRARGHPAGPGRDPGAGLALAAGHPAPRGGRLGRRAPGHAAGRAGGALWAGAVWQGGLSKRRRRAADHRAGGGPGGGRGAGVRAERPSGRAGDRGFRRNRPVRRGPPGQPGRGPPQGSGQARLHRGTDAGAPAQGRLQPPATPAWRSRRSLTCRIWSPCSRPATSAPSSGAAAARRPAAPASGPGLER